MEIRIRCPHCKKKYRVPDSYKERAIKCTACGYPFFVLVQPNSGDSAVAPTPEAPAAPTPTAQEIEAARFLREKAAAETKLAMPAIDPPIIPSAQKPGDSLPPLKYSPSKPSTPAKPNPPPRMI